MKKQNAKKTNHLLGKKILTQMLKESKGLNSLFQELAEANANGQTVSEIGRGKQIYQNGKLKVTVFETCKINTFN